jgi:hypothetical protein
MILVNVIILSIFNIVIENEMDTNTIIIMSMLLVLLYNQTNKESK